MRDMEISPLQTGVPVTMPGSRLKVLVYVVVTVVVLLTAGTGFLMYEMVSNVYREAK